MDGNFEFSNCSAGSILIVSFVGMETKEIKYNGEDFLKITLKPKTDELDEVTVVAFAKQKKESVELQYLIFEKSNKVENEKKI